jgi:hypothetical protein
MNAKLALKEIEPAEGRELVEHEQQLLTGSFRLEGFGEAPADLVEHEPHQRLGTCDVGRRHDKIERYRYRPIDQVTDAPMASRGDPGDDGVAVEAQEAHGGREHA